MTIKVSVVVPAYRPGAGLDRVIGSLDAQTMSAEEFELIIVDDGSPDDTWDRLRSFRDSRSNVRIERIENSGWPSRPRNVGISMARGEYVLFMDHDDELYPDGLRAAYEYAVEHHADVLSPKESKTNDIGWGIGNYTGDIPNAKERRGIASLLPMMPHKLYRRAFLLEHGIRFPEGRRMLWEDIYFNVEAFRHAEVISILSSTPVYRWVETDANNSATYGVADSEYWDKLEALVRFVVATLPGQEHAQARDDVLRHLYRTRVVSRLYNALVRDPDAAWVPMAREHVLALLSTSMPIEYDEHLTAVALVRARLMRADRFDLLARLARSDGGWRPASALASLAWADDGPLLIEVSTRWLGRDGAPVVFRTDGDRLLLDLDPEVAEVVGDAADVSESVLAGRTQVVMRDPTSATTWALPTTGAVELEPVGEGLVTPVLSGTATMSPGRRRADACWQVHTKNSLIGHSAYQALHAEDGLPARMVHGRGVDPRVRRGRLVIDLHHRWDRLGEWSIDPGSVAVVDGPDGDLQVTAEVLTPPLHGRTVTVRGEAFATPPSRLASSVLLGRAQRLTWLTDRHVVTGWSNLYLPESGAAKMRVSVPRLPDGRYRLVPAPSGTVLPVDLELVVDGDTVTARAPATGGKR